MVLDRWWLLVDGSGSLVAVGGCFIVRLGTAGWNLVGWWKGSGRAWGLQSLPDALVSHSHAVLVDAWLPCRL